jgi:hypothetical protein
MLDKATDFATATGVVMKINILNGKALEDYSAFPTEAEILLSPNMRLVVSKGIYQESGQLYVELVQLKEGPTFIF